MTKSEAGVALWRKARREAGPLPEREAQDAGLLAAYLDGRLSEEEAAGLEARLAGDPALLDELLMLRESLAAAPEAATAGVVARARAVRPDPRSALRPEPAASRQVTVRKPSGLMGLFGDWLRPAVPAFAALVLVLACVGAFEMGRYQSEQLDASQAAEAVESDVPVELLLDDIL